MSPFLKATVRGLCVVFLDWKADTDIRTVGSTIFSSDAFATLTSSEEQSMRARLAF
jgi:hypothetical protein